MSFPLHYRSHDNIWVPAGARAKKVDFLYTDGSEVESRLLQTIKQAKDKSLFSDELKRAIVDWPSRYHLSAARANLLRPFAEILTSRVLEVGAGCGAITRFLGELGSEVVAIEGSPQRALIARERTIDLPNVTVVCDRVQNFSVKKKFDVITVIGVLEYSRIYMAATERPEVLLLSHLRSILKPNGLLLVAIENQLGMKYFAGAEEDHVGDEFFGINDLYSAKTVATYGKVELTRIMDAAGFPSRRFYLPFPDYKLPSTIFAPDGILGLHNFNPVPLIAETCRLDHQNPADYTFSLEKAWGVLGRNDLVMDHSNSFLAIAAQAPETLTRLGHNGFLAWHYSVERHPAFAKESAFVAAKKGITVRRRLLANIATPDVPIECRVEDERYLHGTSLWAELLDIVNRPGWTSKDVAHWADEWINYIGAKIGIQKLCAENFSSLVEGKFLDATPFNIVRDAHGELSLIDQEWSLRHKIEYGYLIYRGLIHGIPRITSIAEADSGTPRDICKLLLSVFQHLGIFLSKNDLDRLASLEARVQQWVQGNTNEAFTLEADEQLWQRSFNFRSSLERQKLVREMERLRNELVQKIADNDQLRAGIAGSAAECERLRTEISNITATAQADFERLHGEIEAAQLEIARQAKVANEVAAATVAQQAESERAHAYIASLERQLHKVQAETARQLAAAARAGAAQQAESERVHAHIANLERHLREVQTEAGRQLATAAGAAAAQQAESQRVHAHIANLERQLHEVQAETADQLGAAAEAATAQQAESVRVHAHVANLEEQLQAGAAEAERMRVDFACLNTELTAARADSKRTVDEVAELQEELKEARSELAEAIVQREVTGRLLRQQAAVIGRLQRELLTLRCAPSPQKFTSLFIARLHPGLKRAIPKRVKQFVKTRLLDIE